MRAYAAAALTLAFCSACSTTPPPPKAPPSSFTPISIATVMAPTTDYCNDPELASPQCQPHLFFEAMAQCPPPAKVAAVSCMLHNFERQPALIANTPRPDGTSGACIWQIAEPAGKAGPAATVTLLCGQ